MRVSARHSFRVACRHVGSGGDGSFTLADEAAVRMLLVQEAYLLCRQMGCDGAVGGTGCVRGCGRRLSEAVT